ncbi:MAG: alkyl hydroperoxide reductase [Ardenticatenia bacterium]|nr:alkyl hydroperoxide reductase [Ardenticatenia bacterium]
MLPQLRKLETRFADELVVIGVHSAKFPEERMTANVREAIRRHGVSHPVVNDADMVVWRMYGVYAWPTLVLIDPEGRYVGHHAGEATAEQLTPAIERLVGEFEARGTLVRGALELALEPPPATLLAYPGKLLVDGQRLFIADTNHHRIIVVQLDADGRAGEVEEVIGRGGAGMDDGPFEVATFNHPQGLALLDDTLYVADTENHAIRALHLPSRTVRRVVGTGRLGWSPQRGPGVQVDLNSPWDLTVAQGKLFIAMAGRHQIWVFDPSSGQVAPFAGSGREELMDGPLHRACFAQPSGLASDGHHLFVADSETSSVRRVDLRRGRVDTLVGTGLFDFGDVDGRGQIVRLQHPLGVAHADNQLYLADTYNHKIKVLDLSTLNVRSWLGDGQPGWRDGPRGKARFYEPGDVKVAGSLLYIADTNNHAVRVADRHTGEVATFLIRGVERLAPPTPVEEHVLPPVRVAEGTSTLAIHLMWPQGMRPVAETRPWADVAAKDETVIRPLQNRCTFSPSGEGQVRFEARPGHTEVHMTVHVYACAEGRRALCVFRRMNVRVPISVAPEGERVVHVTVPVSFPAVQWDRETASPHGGSP